MSYQHLNQRKLTLTFNKLFWMICFLSICLPLHTSNSLLSYISITGTVSIMHLIVIIMMLYALVRGLRRRGLLICFLFAMAIIMGMIMGFRSGSGTNSILGDGGMYLLSFGFFFILSSKKIKIKSIEELLEFVLAAMTFSCILSMIMYITRSFSFWGMQSYNGGRYFGGYLSLLEFSIPYAIYILLYKKEGRNWKLLIHIVIGFACMAVAQSRTTVFCVLILSVFVFLFGGKGTSRGQLLRKILIFIVGIIALAFLFNSNLDLIERIRGTNLRNTSETSFARLYLYQYYLPIIGKNLLGVGFGQNIYFITQNLLQNSDFGAYTVDSAILTVGYKIGWLGILLYGLMMIQPLVICIKQFISTNERLFLISIPMWLLFIFSTNLITAQTLHTYACLTYSWLFFGCAIRWRNQK